MIVPERAIELAPPGPNEIRAVFRDGPWAGQLANLHESRSSVYRVVDGTALRDWTYWGRPMPDGTFWFELAPVDLDRWKRIHER
jgi:hypothetical protein